MSWAILKCSIFLAGLPHFTVITDHHPLVSILNHHRLDEIENPRLQRLKMRVMGYNFTTQWVKGTLHNAPDALSRNPVSDPLPEELLAEFDNDNHLESSLAEIRALMSEHQESVRLQVLRERAEQDHEYQQMRHFVINGFPHHRSQLPEECRRYWNVRAHLAMDDDLLVYGCRLVIPQALRRDMLTQLHAAHQGQCA